jgi:hypothetical protein
MPWGGFICRAHVDCQGKNQQKNDFSKNIQRTSVGGYREPHENWPFVDRDVDHLDSQRVIQY